MATELEAQIPNFDADRLNPTRREPDGDGVGDAPVWDFRRVDTSELTTIASAAIWHTDKLTNLHMNGLGHMLIELNRRGEAGDRSVSSSDVAAMVAMHKIARDNRAQR